MTLHLILKAKWFDMIYSGIKKEEYRAITKHWISRLCVKNAVNKHELRHFDTVTFTNGYQPNSRRFEIELKDIRFDTGNTDWGAEEGVQYFVLELGEVLSSNF